MAILTLSFGTIKVIGNEHLAKTSAIVVLTHVFIMKKHFLTSTVILFSFIGNAQVTYRSSDRLSFNPYVSNQPLEAMMEVARYQQQQYYRQQLYKKQKAFNDYWDKIEKVNWSYRDSFSSPYSSFLKGGWYRYYSEDNNFLLLQMNENFYLFKNVPSKLWNGLSNATSKGEYYNYYIRERFLKT